MIIKPINRNLANDIIRTNHYTHKIVRGTKLSLGVWVDGKIEGVVQLGKGYSMRETGKWVTDSKPEDWLEVNRNWLSDNLPHNSESKMWGKVFRYIREHHRNIKYLITFANGISGHVGTQYQATNWTYTGYNTTSHFWVTGEGEMLHPVSLHTMGIKPTRKNLEGIYGAPVYRVRGGQFRYFYFLDKAWRKRLTLTQLPYPKKELLHTYIEITTEDWQLPQPLHGHLNEIITKRKETHQISTINTKWW